jgi:hypothetical protein
MPTQADQVTKPQGSVNPSREPILPFLPRPDREITA